jgi:hypothetical protein
MWLNPSLLDGIVTGLKYRFHGLEKGFVHKRRHLKIAGVKRNLIHTMVTM